MLCLTDTNAGEKSRLQSRVIFSHWSAEQRKLGVRADV